MTKPLKYRRIVLKISGEGFCKKGGRGLDIAETEYVAREIASVARARVQLAVVVGGGNIIRGREFSELGVTKATADYMGMLATVVNALALQDIIEKKGIPTRLLTAIPMQAVAEPFIRRRCVRHLEKGRVVILAAGTGNPHFTTDTTAALRAAEISADAILKATKVNGVYDSDPLKNPQAKIYTTLSYMDLLKGHLQIMDSTAVTLCMENHIPIIVFNLKKSGHILNVVRGKRLGTIIS